MSNKDVTKLRKQTTIKQIVKSSKKYLRYFD